MAERKEYPRPQFQRESWQNLNGKWEFAFDDNNEGKTFGWWKGDKKLDQKIIVPFSYQYPASGINDKAIHDVTWYRRTFVIDKENSGKRVLLCFNAADYETDVWVNGIHAINHKGGFAPFSVDITDYLNGAENVLVVRCYDGLETAVPRGKQHWEGITYGCFYYPNSGIWQSVWLEFFEQDCIESYSLKADIDNRSVKGEIHTMYALADEAEIVLTFQGKILQKQRLLLPHKRTRFTVDLADNAFDFNGLLWSPENPNLISVDFTLYADGKPCDRAHTRLGLRKVHIDETGKICLNNKPLYQRLILDQGYWEESGLTPPSAEAIKKDIELAKAMGFNGARKHQKFEDPYFYYYAEELGFLTWCEMPSALTFCAEEVASVTREWQEILSVAKNFTSNIAYVPLNESWGVREIGTDKAQQDFARSLYYLTKSIDGEKLISTNDGFENVNPTDIVTIHDYEIVKAEQFPVKYKDGKYDGLYPQSWRLFAEGNKYECQPVLFTEFGGMALKAEQKGDTWGYNEGEANEETFYAHLTELLQGIAQTGFQGYCYTQLTDIQQEINGLLRADHTPKFDLTKLKAIFETGKKKMLNGKFIGVKERAGVFALEKKFAARAGEKAVLKSTALGLYFAELNGVRVGDAYLAPGWTSYNKMLQVQEYDVSAMLKEGENILSLTVGEGWFCSGITWDKKRDLYGKQSAVCADLVLSDRTIFTDESWTAHESFIRESGIYDGETQDFTAERKSLTVCEVAFDKSVLVPQISEPVRNIERLKVKEVIRTPAGELVYDFGQNMAGVVEIRTPENFSGTLTLQFAEILVNGNFYTDNLRSAKATDTFTVKGAKTLLPEFTFHGFRYMKLTGAELPKENITAIVRHTDMKRTGRIQTSNARFNRLLDNVVWGQKGNFVDIPTDCPQRDERLGWTGDINAFCTTAAYNYDIRLFMKKWLADLRNDQAEDGKIPHVVPDALRGEGDRSTAALWSDAAVMIPWKLYRMYGDVSFLADNYAVMQKYMNAYEKNVEDGLVVRGFGYGDWLAQDGEKFNQSICGRTESMFLASAFYLECLRIVSETARLLGDKAEEQYRARHQKTLKRMRAEYITPNGRVSVDTMTAQALALCLGIVPEENRKNSAKVLSDNARAHGYKVTTGFAGTPYLLFALADNGYIETAFKILLNSSFPGWLYEVDMGATTIWERWDSLLPDGTPNPDGMNSYNHYAYGSVMEFVYRRIAGIDPIEAGFGKVRVAPNPCEAFQTFKAEYESVCGKIVSCYEQKDGKIIYEIELPDGVEGKITLPNESPLTVCGGRHVFERKCEDFHYTPFTPESYVTEVFDSPKAVKAFNEVFGGIFTGSEIAWMKDEPKTLGFMAEFRDKEGKMNLSDFPAMLERANELFTETDD